MHGADADASSVSAHTPNAMRPEEHVAAGPPVGAAGAEEVAAEDGEPDRPDEDERERERRAGEGDHVPGAPVAPLAAERRAAP